MGSIGWGSLVLGVILGWLMSGFINRLLGKASATA